MTIDFAQIFLGLITGVLGTTVYFLLKKNNLQNSTLPANANETISALKIENGTRNGELKSTKEQLEKTILKQEELNLEIQSLISENGHLLANKQQLEIQHTQNLHIKESLQKEFELIAHKIIEKNALSFNETSQRSLKGILDPLKEKMSDFEKEINNKYVNEAKDKASLKTEIAKLVELNARLSDEANQLTNALKGSNKHQGNWGEIILEKVLERSGLDKGTEFSTQHHIQNQDGTTQIPDAVIFLPDNKHIIIDSKVSLTAYERMVNASSEEVKTAQLKLHIISLKSHIKELSDKKYYASKELNSPEFTLLFLPIEASFSAALKEDTELFHYAWDRNIIIVSPTTLLATLRTVASTWKHDKQTRHVLEIAKEGGALHDKFVAFVDDLQKIEKNIIQSQTAYTSAFNKLSSGKGNLVNRTNKLKVLGAKANKALSSELIETSQNSDFENQINE
ncbi:MAG: DNA recombination protein RmuC [Salibacteraceae bacterium]|jgi:DNA recombination protein RmuC